MNDESPTRRSPGASPGSTRLVVALAVLLVVGMAGWYAWHAWQSHRAQTLAKAVESDRQLDTLLQRMATLRGDLGAQNRLIRDAAGANRLLRDEVLALGQRNALLEETVARLAASSHQGSQAVRLDEVELLLVLGTQRLRIAGDAEGARRAFALASHLLDGLDDPGLLNLRQTLASERDALEALGAGPRASVAVRLQAVIARLPQLPLQGSIAPGLRARAPWWQRVLAPLVQVRPAGSQDVLTEADRQSADDALQLELTLARAALERGDIHAFHTALNRSRAWMARLWPDSPALREVLGELDALRAVPLQPQVPALDATLLQLRALRDGRSPS